jgi:hypothetical protein
LEQNRNLLGDLREDERNKLDDLKRLRLHEHIECTDEFTEDLEDFYNVEVNELYNDIMDRKV